MNDSVALGIRYILEIYKWYNVVKFLMSYYLHQKSYSALDMRRLHKTGKVGAIKNTEKYRVVEPRLEQFYTWL